jgi:hypothetical protein
MPNLIPFAVIHVGLSFALAAILILLYRQLSRADFLLYWALFWIDVGINIAASQVATPLLFSVPGAPALLFSFSFSLTATYPALMLCAAFSPDMARGAFWRRPACWRFRSPSSTI